MKAIISISILTGLLLALSGQSFAMMSVGDVSRERAKE